MMAFAGLWDAWKDPSDDKWLQSFSIVTTDASETMAPVHNRMPVILHPGDFDRWLSREGTHQPQVDLLPPFPADEMEAFAVSKDVGDVKNNSADLLQCVKDRRGDGACYLNLTTRDIEVKGVLTLPKGVVGSLQ